MSAQIAIPCLFMRGGTSRGPFFNRNHLPEGTERLAQVLAAAVGAGHPLNIDGIGGGAAVTTKVAMISPSQHDWADIDYFFAQVNVEDSGVDFSPSCGNMLAGVGPAAIEMGLMPSTPGETTVRIRAVNTGALVESIVQTPAVPLSRVDYDGEATIDGVPGQAAPIHLNFRSVVGSKTGALLPTGKVRESIDGIDVTLIDVAVPMMMLRAEDLDISGHEPAQQLTGNKPLMKRLESLRLQAGERMGLGDVSRSVVPKIGLLANPQGRGCVAIRYFMPWQCHPTLAVTGGMAFAATVLQPGTIADGIARIDRIDGSPTQLIFEHPMGEMAVSVNYTIDNDKLDLRSAGTLRTARLLMRGEIMIPAAAFRG